MVAKGNGGTSFRPSAFGLPAIHTDEMMITDMTDITTTVDLQRPQTMATLFADTAATPSAWPYSACSGILDRKLAANIRAWGADQQETDHT